MASKSRVLQGPESPPGGPNDDSRPCWRRVAAYIDVGLAAAGERQPLDYNRHKNTENRIPFSANLNSPDVADDGTVTFRLRAPAAKEVLLSGVAVLTALKQSWRGVPFTRDEDGARSLRVAPLQPDMHAYHLLVDGMRMADPNNTHSRVHRDAAVQRTGRA